MSKKEKFKNLLIKILKWVKSNWFGIIIVLSILFLSGAIVRSCNKEDAYQTLFDQYSQSIDDYKQQLDSIRTSQQEEQVKQDQRLQQYLNKMNEIQRDYKQQIQRIEKQRLESQSQIVNNAERDPGTLTERIRNTWGIPIDE